MRKKKSEKEACLESASCGLVLLGKIIPYCSTGYQNKEVVDCVGKYNVLK
jgi:hypothetical protein